MDDLPDDVDATTRARWASVVETRARDHWTPARTAAFADGKRLRLPPADAAVLLRALGLLNADATMPPARVRKYWQACHLVGLVEPLLADLAAPRPIRIIDAGCGRSYLTLILAYLGAQPGGVPVRVLGVDRNPEVIAAAQRRTRAAGLGAHVRFAAVPLDRVDVAAAWREAFDEAPGELDAVIGLHACDAASCEAIALAHTIRARVVAIAPCCQAELARGWAARANEPSAAAFAPVWATPHLRRELAAHVTDTMRMLVLRAIGFDAQAVELVPDEHTRKNTLLRARRAAPDPSAWQAYRALVDATGGVGLRLADRLG